MSGRRWPCPGLGTGSLAADRLVAGLCSLVVLMATGGCAGTPWGDTLSGSFPAPGPSATGDPPPPSPGGAALSPAPEGTPPSPAGSGPQATNPPAKPRAPEPSPAPAGSGSPATNPAGKPRAPQPPAAPARKLPPDPRPGVSSPYRVTLRLPLADPSAPAEAVTQALRAAGIVFEVETIERVKGAAAPQAPMAGDGAPAVRPAPPPR